MQHKLLVVYSKLLCTNGIVISPFLKIVFYSHVVLDVNKYKRDGAVLERSIFSYRIIYYLTPRLELSKF